MTEVQPIQVKAKIRSILGDHAYAEFLGGQMVTTLPDGTERGISGQFSLKDLANRGFFAGLLKPVRPGMEITGLVNLQGVVICSLEPVPDQPDLSNYAVVPVTINNPVLANV